MSDLLSLLGVKWTSNAQGAKPALPLLPGLKVLDRRISAPPQDGINPFQHDVMDFEAFVEGDLPQRFIDRLREVDA